MKTLILGGTGMLGHKLWQSLQQQFDTRMTIRGSFPSVASYGIYDPQRTIGGVSADVFASVATAIDATRPDVVVNCIGIVKQAGEAKDPVPSITVNALFPHLVARHCQSLGARFIHISTDCVFSGKQGHYSESDLPDATDLYGRSKLLGEVSAPGCLTLRTSMIGRELNTSHGLVEWFLSQSGMRVRGFRKAIFSGLTTIALADVIAQVITRHPTLTGVYHVAADPIAKFDLLGLIQMAYAVPIEIEADESFACDRSLNGEAFAKATGIIIPRWPKMIESMASDPTPYPTFRRS